MDAYNDYTAIFLLLSPLCFYIIAVSLRLMDNSALLFLQRDILVDSSNVSVKEIEEQLESSIDSKFKKQLKRALIFRKLHRICIIMMFICIPVTIITYFTLF